jgi:selenocysteine-specific elongation factor
MLSGRLRLLPSVKRPLRYNASVSFHTGASESMAKIRLLEKEQLEPGESAWVQVVLTEPLAVVKGDRFIVRSTQDTIGGGEVVESHTRRYRRYRAATVQSLETKQRGSPQEVLLASLQADQPQEAAKLISASALPVHEAKQALQDLTRDGATVEVGSGEHRLLFTAGGWERLLELVTSAVHDYHKRFPARPGMPRGDLSVKLKVPPASFTTVLHRILDEGVLVEEEALVRLPSHQIQFSSEQQGKIDAFLRSLAANPYSPPSDAMPDAELVNVLIKQGRVVKVGEGVVFASSAYDEMVKMITEHIGANGKITLGEARDLLKTSRKYAQPLLEYLDQQKITRRVGDERVLGSRSD